MFVRVVNIYISVIPNCKILDIALYSTKMRQPFRSKTSLVPLSLAFSSHCLFCVNDYKAKMYAKIDCNISSGRYGVCLPAIQPFLKFSYFSTHKVPLMASFELRKSLNRRPSLAYPKIYQ